jgi:hypothetical protein
MDRYFLNASIKNLLYLFITTKRPLYVYNILLRYFYFYFLHERIVDKLKIKLDLKPLVSDLQDWYTKPIPYSNISRSLSIINSEYWIPLCGVDHTFYYSLDIESNTELFRHFSLYDWKNWKDGVVLEVGSGFGIYVFLFNLFKKYYENKNLYIYSFDFDQYKIDKLKDLYRFLGLVDKNDFILGDCSEKETFKFLNNKSIHLFYSETFSGKGAHTQDYFKIMDNLFNNFRGIINPENIFPYWFIINKKEYSALDYVNYVNNSNSDEYLNHFIDGFIINNRYQSLTGYDIDDETIEIKNYIQEKFKKRIGFRWGINIV